MFRCHESIWKGQDLLMEYWRSVGKMQGNPASRLISVTNVRGPIPFAGPRDIRLAEVMSGSRFDTSTQEMARSLPIDEVLLRESRGGHAECWRCIYPPPPLRSLPI